MLRRWTAIVRRPAVVSTLLLSMTGYAIGPQLELIRYPLKVAALVQRHHDPVPTESPAVRAAERLGDESPADRTRVEATLAAAASDERPYLLKVLADGHSADDVVTFARLIRGKRPRWLRTHLNLIDLGLTRFDGHPRSGACAPEGCSSWSPWARRSRG
ncbi:hypothetical protein AB0E63_45520, partial [Kribbella sp. NPDC026596]|uniref:hypothetical protein n=1 Tax=Kribbella sp. NPDC026596 TaxID=3155122 RepID=UPI0033C42EA8